MKTTITLVLFFFSSLALRAQSTPPSPDAGTGRIVDTVNTDRVVFTKVEVESEFPGGNEGWRAYLTKNFHYPKAAVRKNIQGEVLVQFIVDKQGKVSDVEVIKSVDPLLDKEAMRLIKESPNWKPAEQNGRPVKSYKKQPVIFRLEH